MALCPGLPLHMTAQVAQFLGTRHSYSAGSPEGHSMNMQKAGFHLHEIILYIHKYAVHICHLHLQDTCTVSNRFCTEIFAFNRQTHLCFLES